MGHTEHSVLEFGQLPATSLSVVSVFLVSLFFLLNVANSRLTILPSVDLQSLSGYFSR